MDNEKIVQDLMRIRNLSKHTVIQYRSSIYKYSNFCEKSMKELLNEADDDEKNQIRWKDRRLRKRLISYREYLYKNLNISTVKSQMSRIYVVYKTYEIEIHPLPYMSDKQAIQTEPLSYSDLLTKDIIKHAVKIAKPNMKAIILFMSSSGIAKRETLNLIIEDFIKATSDYHSNGKIQDILFELKKQKNIVPMWRIKRQKTNKYYYTFSSPESTKAIIYHLLNTKKPLALDKNLFETNDRYFHEMFKGINDKLKIGQVGGYARFRPHMLRKFHASNLYKGNDKNGLDMDTIDALQGRTKDKTRNSYFIEDPRSLKEDYIKAINKITIFDEINLLNIKSKEYKEL